MAKGYPIVPIIIPPKSCHTCRAGWSLHHSKAHPVEAEGAFSQGIFFDVPTINDLKTLASVKLAPSEKDKKCIQ